MGADEYLLDNRATETGSRFDALSAIFDAVTFRHIDALGIRAGWRCWEVGAGGPSVPAGLAARVGETGRVLATDIELGWLADQASPGVEVTRHDVVNDDPPAGDFDLVHARLVLLHLPERDRALRRMAAAVRPGGWLLIEDFDISLQPLVCPDSHGPDQHLANKIKDGFRALLFERGVDAEFGRRLPRLFRAAGLLEVAADAYFPLAVPGVAALEHANIHQVRDNLINGGHASSQEVDTYLALVASGRLDLATAPLISTWGRRPPTPDRE